MIPGTLWRVPYALVSLIRHTRQYSLPQTSSTNKAHVLWPVRTSVLVQKFVVSRTDCPDFRLGVWRAVMLKHHPGHFGGRTTKTVGPDVAAHDFRRRRISLLHFIAPLR